MRSRGWKVVLLVLFGILLAMCLALSASRGEGMDPPPEEFEIRTPTPTYVPLPPSFWYKYDVYLPQVGVGGLQRHNG